MAEFHIIRRDQLAGMPLVEGVDPADAARAHAEARNLPPGEFVAFPAETVEVVKVSQRTVYEAEPVSP